MIWTKALGEENVHDIAHSFSKNKEGNTYTLTGYSSTSKEGLHEGLFIQIDEHGNQLKHQTHDTGDDLRLMHSEETTDGGFIVAGYSRKDITKNIHDAVLLKFNKDGKVEWVKTFGDTDKDDQGYWIVVNSDGTYTFTGYTHSAGNNGDIWLMKSKSNGEF